ncbi:permease [Deltaproteobacteria bacterium Smac51]|nr:permease [Deltaproteobacteria bacterium Smac51]
MIENLRLEFIHFWPHFTAVLREIGFYWLIGIGLGSAISVFGKSRITGLMTRLEQRRMGLWGLVPASLIGLLSPLCMYGTIPVAASFAQKGVREDWLAAFMMSSVLLNPQLLIYTAALGWPALIIRTISCLFCGIFAGLCVGRFYKNRSFFNFAGFNEPGSRDDDPAVIRRLGKNIGRNIKATGGYFLLGILLASAFQAYVPADGFGRLFGHDSGAGVLMAATVGVPLYVCGGGTIPLLHSWMQSGMGLGAATAFMITGPTTKITNLGALKIVLGLRNFILYIIFSIGLALLLGLAVNILR